MKNIQQDSGNQRDSVICPYLGLSHDPATSLGFPSIWNCCHRTRPVESPNLEHQSVFCLAANHTQCPVFERAGDFSMPPEMRAGSLEVRNGMWSFQKIALGVFIVLVFLVVVLMGRQIIANVFRSTSPIVTPSNETPVLDSTMLTTPSNVSPSDTFTLEPTFTTIPSQTLTPSLTPTASFTPTFTPSPTSTPRHPLSMDVPLGLGNKFLVHRVLDGESLELFANMYHTTIEAIRAVNYYLPSPLWVDYVVVIPLEPGNIQSIPPFEPYKVEKNITVHDLAQKLTMDASALAYYNALNGEDILMPGDWLLIPRAKPTPTQ